ncbi:MAG TPA: MipA/OmpV family protein [Steroidobacteraceae bacterium]|nr:MipA/OmpV family protein [Steroidobacteraceae bacterium]
MMVLIPRTASSQTPSPLQEWQYSAGIILVSLFEPELPDWRVQVGLAAEPRPAYEGARNYRTLAGPVIDVRYRDEFFASTGEGIGYNFVRGENYRVGIAVGYDLGRREKDDLNHLKGLGNIEVAPLFKVFGSYVVSKEFPLVLRGDLRRILGGAEGWVGDLEAYLPLPGSSEKFVMFAGPSVTFADRRHMQTAFGVDHTQALASGYPEFAAHGGMNAVGLGFSATRFLNRRWLVNADLAVNRLLGSARDSPFTHEPQKTEGTALVLTGGALTLSVMYAW